MEYCSCTVSKQKTFFVMPANLITWTIFFSPEMFSTSIFLFKIKVRSIPKSWKSNILFLFTNHIGEVCHAFQNIKDADEEMKFFKWFNLQLDK